MEVIFAFLILIYASFLDLKYREIDDKSWMSLVVLGFLFLTINYTGEGTDVLIPFAFSAGFTLALVALLYSLGMMGSGDCKIIFGVSVLLPTPVHFSIFPIFSLGMFTNAIILSTMVPIFFFIYNLRRLRDVRNTRDFLVLFLGYKRKGTEIRPFEVALENEEGIKIFLNTKGLELGKKLSTERIVWVSPAIPFVVFITIGFLVSVLFGDFISYASLIWGVI
jgi:preflagellin peptidase FlaK